jgi:tetratricopeptide (TPR) repeat protein
MSSLPRTRAFTWVATATLATLLSACGSAPTTSDSPPPRPVEPDSTVESRAARQGAKTAPLPDEPTASSGQSGAAPGTATAPGTAPGAAAPLVAVPPRAQADFNRAVGLMRAGQAGEAELEFKQLASGYPQLAGPHINLGLLQRKAGRLDEAEKSLRAAVEKNPANAMAWNELGVTLRMAGKFQDAASAYESALAADPNYAPAHRNFGVLLDLYLGDAERALTELERYKELTGEDKPVSGWIAELRQRTGKPAAPRPQANPPAETPPESGEAPSEAPPAETPAEPARAGG